MLIFGACSEPNAANRAELPETVTYNDHIEAVFNRSCVRCHGGAVTHGVDLSSYSVILQSVGTSQSEDLIVIGNPQSKLLKIKLSPETGEMYQYLNDPAEYDLIYKWIVEDSLKQGL